MKARTLLVCIYLLNFLFGILSSIYLVHTLWAHLELWQLTHYAHYFVLGLCGIVLSLWIAVDGKHVEHCTRNIRDLERRIVDFEKKIDHIKISISESRGV
jgi:hypothetical protein